MPFWCLQFLPKNKQKTGRTVVRTNSFVRFLEEFTTWQFAFEINWPLHFAAAYRICLTAFLNISICISFKSMYVCLFLFYDDTYIVHIAFKNINCIMKIEYGKDLLTVLFETLCLDYSDSLEHGLWTPNEALFHLNPKLLGLDRRFGQINFAAFGVFLPDLSAPLLVLRVPCPCFPSINHNF